MAAAGPPPPCSLNPAPAVPTSLTTWCAPLVPPNAVLMTSYAVTTGPDRHVHFGYGAMPATPECIPLPGLTLPTCFEARDSLALSQGKVGMRQRCATCNQSVARHSTFTIMNTAFNNHQAQFPLAHANLFTNAPYPPTFVPPVGYAAANGFTAPVTLPAVMPPALVAAIAAANAPAAPLPPLVPIVPPAPAPAAPAVVPALVPVAPVALAPMAPAPAPVASTGVGPLGYAPIPPPPAAPVAPVVPIAPVNDMRDTPSVANVYDLATYNTLTHMVRINPTSQYSDDMEAYQFISGLELILRGSPVAFQYWTALMLLMIPGTYSLVRDWVHTNIIAQLLSWNAATVAFVEHFQRSDYREGRHALYTAAKQSPDESTQAFSRRFQTLVMQLRIADTDRMY